MSDLPEQLPVVKTVINATVITYRNLPYLFRISWIAILVLAIARFLLEGHTTILDLYFKHALLGIICLLLASMVAVAWHRFILLGEVTLESGYFQFDQRTWNYFYFWLVVCLMTWTISLILAVVQYFSSINFRIFTAVLTLVFCLLLLLLVRLAMVLPAKALGVEAITLNSVWQMTRRHFGALVVGFVLMTLPALPLIGVTYLFDVRDGVDVSTAYRALDALVRSACDFVMSGLSLSFMSLAFKHIYELPDQTTLGQKHNN